MLLVLPTKASDKKFLVEISKKKIPLELSMVHRHEYNYLYYKHFPTPRFVGILFMLLTINGLVFGIFSCLKGQFTVLKYGLNR